MFEGVYQFDIPPEDQNSPKERYFYHNSSKNNAFVGLTKERDTYIDKAETFKAQINWFKDNIQREDFITAGKKTIQGKQLQQLRMRIIIFFCRSF